ncbi:UCH-domain-containing protein [Testicularia cyperi]|uniref:ubiquitinyl hydrolase 1 n=1 Tax=Testicularia cyperi TaxID=1882483 RepID=A0A317XS73_9BASI|nr:UCH-domain-containing protein [Testicularia cyperi]
MRDSPSSSPLAQSHSDNNDDSGIHNHSASAQAHSLSESIAKLEPRVGSIRRTAPSPVQSPEATYIAQFDSSSSASTSSSLPAYPPRLGSYKRARTVSPIIDENSSDVEQEAQSIYSRSNSELGDLETGSSDPSAAAAPSVLTPLHPASQLLPTPLRESFSSSDIVANPTMAAPEQTIEGLMTEKSLSLDDKTSKQLNMQSNVDEDISTSDTLPSYQQALGQSVVDCDAPCSRPSGTEQLSVIKPMKNRALQAGDTWYLIAKAWYRRWDAHCSSQLVVDEDDDTGSDPVGPIDNSPLVDENSTPSQPQLKEQIMESIHYEMVPQEGWELLSQWYGVTGPVFARKVVEGLSAGQESVEFYPPIVRLLKIVDDSAAQGSGMPSFSISSSSPLSELKIKVKTALGLDTTLADTDMRFWHLPEPTDDEAQLGFVAVERTRDEDVEQIDAGEAKPDTYKPHVSLKSLGIDERELILAVETRTAGRWISEPPTAAMPLPSRAIFAQQGGDFFSNLQQGSSASSSSAASASASASAAAGDAQGRMTRSQTAMDRSMGRSRGLRGLNNLGNTCFMNSALQCMSNTYELQQYFVSGVYRDELNKSNPLGMGGAIAEAFGNLVNNLWNGQGGSFWPREFKYALSRFAPQFSGYAQHDSQELLAFLLDGLHEDLNRILKKPYIEAPDWEGGNERDLVAFAKRQWDIYKARNDSVIVDLFQGQYRSTLVCPDCGKVSFKFDPFMYLTLPIPNKRMWKGHVYFVPYAAQSPVQKFEIQLPAGSTFSKIRQKVATHFSVDAKRLVCGEVWHHRIYKWLDDYEPVIDIKAGDYVYLWELPTAPRFSRQHQGYRYFSSVQEAEEDLEVPDEEYAVLPVYTSYEQESASSSFAGPSYGNRHGRKEAAGIPFFISVPKSEVNDIDAVRAAVLEGYKRFSDDPQQLIAAVETSAGGSTQTFNTNGKGQAHISDWEMVDESSRSDRAVDLVTSSGASGDEGVVTEIREDGEAVVVPDVSVRSAETDADAAVMVDRSDATTEAKPSTQTAPLLSIRFGVGQSGGPMPKGGNDGSESTSEDLFERHARLSVASVHSLSRGDDDDDNDEEFVDPDGVTANGAGKASQTAKIMPLVYTGGALLCSWSPQVKEQKLLIQSESKQLWGPVVEIVDDAIRASENSNSGKPKTLSIEDCMDEFTKEEQLGEDDPWYCPDCKEFRQATKKFDLWKVPDILVVHLKRFSAGRHSRDKLNVLVDFPLEGLDLTERVEGTKAVRRVQAEAEANGEELSESMLGSGILRPLEDNDDAVATDRPIYDLYAVDNHFGGLGGGHYTAFAKNPADGKWYEFDDSSVRPVANPETVKSSSAYLLFYRRRTTRPIGGKSRQKFQEAAKTRQNQTTAASTTVAPSPLSSTAVTASDTNATVDLRLDSDSDTEAETAPPSQERGQQDGDAIWSFHLRGGPAVDENHSGTWSSNENSPASSTRPLSPISDAEPSSP